MERQDFTLSNSLGRGHLRSRRSRGWTQEFVAFRMRGLGFITWSRSAVAAFERGDRQVSVDELLGLSLVHGMSVSEFVEVDGTTRLGALLLPTDCVRDMLAGSDPRSLLSNMAAEQPFPLNDNRVFAASLLALETRLARRLRVPVEAVIGSALRCYGRSATEERDRRVSTLPRQTLSARRTRISVGRMIGSEIALELGRNEAAAKGRSGSPGRRVSRRERKKAR